MTRFERESEMLPLLVEHVPRVLSHCQAFAIAPERPEGRRIVDLVAAGWRADSWRDEILAEPPSLKDLTLVDLAILAHIVAHWPATSEEIKTDMFLSNQLRAQERLDLFEARDLVCRNERDAYEPLEWTDFLPTSTVAFELKLDRWNEALEQAQYTKRFVDLSYVVMSSHALSRIQANERLFRDTGVGVIVADPTGSLEVVVPATSNGAAEYERCLYALRILRDMAGHHSAWSIYACEGTENRIADDSADEY